MKAITVTRTRHRLLPDATRVLAKPYLPGEEILLPAQSRAHLLMQRVLAIPETRIAALNAEILERFGRRHRDFPQLMERQFEAVASHIDGADRISAARRQLIGAYFMHEYSIEAASLFNPSIVRAPDQQGMAAGAVRFVMSLRAVGEGHLSSIEFRTGVLGPVSDVVGTRSNSRPSSSAYGSTSRIGPSVVSVAPAGSTTSIANGVACDVRLNAWTL